MATIKHLSDYRDEVAGLDPSQLLGNIVWFTVGGSTDRIGTGVNTKRVHVPVRVTREQLAVWFDELGLDPNRLPPAILKINAFRLASTKTEKIHQLDKDTTERIFTKEIDSNDEFVLRHVHRSVTNSKKQTTGYAHVATLKFMRGARSSKGKRPAAEHLLASVLNTIVEIGADGQATGNRYNLVGDERARVDAFVQEFDDRYRDLSANLNEDRLRGVVRDYVTSLNAISIKSSGGVYFVHISRQETVNALETLVNRMGPGCSFDQVPLLNTPRQRTMLSTAFQEEVVSECEALLVQILEVEEKANKKNGGKINGADYASLKNKWDDLVTRSEEYTEVLGLLTGQASDYIDLSLTKLMTLTDRIGTK